MKTKPIPAIFMLLAGFIACVFGIYQNYEMERFLKTVLTSMVVFLIIGQIGRIILDINMKKMAQKSAHDEHEGEAISDSIKKKSQEESDGDEEEQ